MGIFTILRKDWRQRRPGAAAEKRNDMVLTSFSQLEAQVRGMKDARRMAVAVAADAHKAGLTWNNDAILIAAAFLNVLCGVILGFVLLLVGKRMILEACGVAVFMLVMVGQFNRVRSLTDEGERLQCSAGALGGAAEADREALSRHWPLAAALSKAGEIKSEEASLGGELRERLHAAYYGAATLRRSRKK